MGDGPGANSIDLAEVSVLQLYMGQYTASSSAEPIPQLNCLSGCFGGYLPTAVVCHNLGWTGVDFAWSCEIVSSEPQAVLFSLVDITVSCEGFRGPGDRYIVPGSCGLYYSLVHSNQQQRPVGDSQQLGIVHLADISVLHLNAMTYATSHYGSPTPQMICESPAELCLLHAASSATCYNAGWDVASQQITWDCDADFYGEQVGQMVDFDLFTVNCEGSSGVPGELTVVEGSCVLEYSLRVLSPDEAYLRDRMRGDEYYEDEYDGY